MKWRIIKKETYRLMLLLLCLLTTVLTAEENTENGEKKAHLLPLAGYSYFTLGSQSLHSPGAGLIFQSENTLIIGLYTFHLLNNTSPNSASQTYHSLEFILDGHKNQHTYLAVFKSEADKPVHGGLNTFQCAAVYGYELYAGSSLSLILGGGLGVSDFGIETADGSPWPLLPLPFIRMNYGSRWIETSFEFLTSPNISFTVAPEKQIRFTGDFRMDQFRDIRDLIFKTALQYRFFPPDHPMGDIAGVSLGIQNDIYAFDIAGKDDPVEIQYLALFGEIDLTLLNIRGGYTFTDTDNGFFVSLTGIYQF